MSAHASLSCDTNFCILSLIICPIRGAPEVYVKAKQLRLKRRPLTIIRESIVVMQFEVYKKKQKSKITKLLATKQIHKEGNK